MTVYTLFGQPASPASIASDQLAYTMGMEFSLSSAAQLTGIWFNSASGAGVLPSHCLIYKVSDTSVVPSTENDTPSWSGAAGSGWVKCTYDGSVTLASGTNYKVAVHGGGGADNWYSATGHYWDSGPGGGGLTSGIITAPNNAGGDGGQDTFTQNTSLTYPSSSFNAGNYWVDVEVTVSGASLTATAALAVTPAFSATLSKVSSLTATAALSPHPAFFARLINASDKNFPSGFYPFTAFNNSRFKPFH